MTPELEQRLQDLLDKQDIHEVLLRYCRGENRDDKQLVLDSFWPDSEVHNQTYHNWPKGTADSFPDDHPNPPKMLEYDNAEQCYEGWFLPPAPPNRPFFNFIGQHLIEIEGDQAYCEAYFVSYNQGLQQPSWALPEGQDPAVHTRGTVEATDGKKYMRVRAGRYCDRFEKRKGVWKVAHRIVTDDWSIWLEIREEVKGLGPNHGRTDLDDAWYKILRHAGRDRGFPPGLKH